MASKNKLEIQFKGYEQLQKRLKEVGGNAQKTAESAVAASHHHITRKAKTAIKPHRKTGKTESTLRETAYYEWTGTIMESKVGFEITPDSLASIFLMYGTPSKKPDKEYHVKPDENLKDAFYGSKTKNEVQNLQREVYEKSIERTMKKNES